MYNRKTDEQNKQFGLNRDLVNSKGADQVKILTSSSVDLIKLIENPNLYPNGELYFGEQLKLL